MKKSNSVKLMVALLVSSFALFFRYIVSTASYSSSERVISPSVWAFYFHNFRNAYFDGDMDTWKRSDGTDPLYYPLTTLTPELGLYSSRDPEVVRRHFETLSRINVDAIIVDWDNATSFKYLFDIAESFPLKIGIQVRCGEHNTGENISRIIDQYIAEFSTRKNVLKLAQRPVVCLYDAQNIDNAVLARHDQAYVIGSGLKFKDYMELFEAGLDGGYSYFVTDGFTPLSTTELWKRITGNLRERGFNFIPTVGPGYNDSLVNHWNYEQKMSRSRGKYYEAMFTKAIEASPDVIMINSFNGWAERTEIEPVVSTDEDYGEPSDLYIRITKKFIDMYKQI